MMNTFLSIAILVVLAAGLRAVPGKVRVANDSAEGESSAKSVYDFTVKDIEGDDVSLSKYKGSVLLIVNVASK